MRAFIISKDSAIGRLLVTVLVVIAVLGSHFAGRAGETTTVTYTDVTQASGIHFRNNSATPEKYLIETMTGGVAIFDYDNDGNWICSSAAISNGISRKINSVDRV